MDERIEKMRAGSADFTARIARQNAVYSRIVEYAQAHAGPGAVFRVSEPALFRAVIENFGPALDSTRGKTALSNIYDVGLHRETGALLISNKGATLFCHSPKTETPFILRHIGVCVYMPGLGVEFVNVGISGDVYSGPVIVRSESSCTPSFLFGSQRCNCAHQWHNMLELVAHFHPARPPATKSGSRFEHWVQNQVAYAHGKHIFVNPEPQPGFILLHIDTQNGMGSGYSEGEFSHDLFIKASIRHRGEYSAEQVCNETMRGGFEAIGVPMDPRREGNGIGYRVTMVILDYLDVSKNLVCLTNNQNKIRYVEMGGYRVARLKSIGEVNTAGAQEAEQRRDEFGHLDISGKPVSFKKELERLKDEIRSLNTNARRSS